MFDVTGRETGCELIKYLATSALFPRLDSTASISVWEAGLVDVEESPVVGLPTEFPGIGVVVLIVVDFCNTELVGRAIGLALLTGEVISSFTRRDWLERP